MNTIEDLLQKLARAEISPEEKSYLFKWIADNHREWSLSLYDDYRFLIESNQPVLDEERGAKILHQIHNKIGEFENADSDIRVKGWGRFYANRFFIYSAAIASVLLAITFGFLLPREKQVLPSNVLTGLEQTKGDIPLMITNNRLQVMPLRLPDGSTALLYPSSSITYSGSSGSKREVILKGKAFFEVVKNKEKPFVVFANEMITEVLGTSFMINAFEEDKQFSIVVRSGKVSVSSQTGASVMERDEVSLEANEQVLFDRAKKAFRTLKGEDLTELDIRPPSLPQIYRFKSTPVTEIFSMLERDYDITIEVDQELLAGCSLTTVLKDEPLFEKLQIVCEGIGSGTSFSMEPEKIIVNSRGCNN